jgi:hypothetical protein
VLSFAECVQALAAAGVRAHVEGDDLVLSGAGSLTAEVRAAVREHKAALVAGIRHVLGEAAPKRSGFAWASSGEGVEEVRDERGRVVARNVWQRV